MNIELYQQMICDMIYDITDEKFLRQIYSVIYRQRKRTGA